MTWIGGVSRVLIKGVVFRYGEAYRDADEIDGHEKEVDTASKVGEAQWPDLGYENAADRPARGGKV